jgi:hypothetical protein
MAAKKTLSTVPTNAPTTPAKMPATGPLAHIFGVRHLSPMGAWHLERFLDKIDPTAVLVEGPSDATDEIQYLIDDRTKPPVALLAFTQKRPVRSILYPLAAYSPEWIALRWALGKNRVARFMDLPSEVFLGQGPAEDEMCTHGESAEGDETTESDETENPETDTQRYLGDPYTAIAELSGEVDHDAWWERHFEHSTEMDSYRLSIFEFGKQLRALEYESPARRAHTVLREAYMRRKIRQTIAEGHDPDKIVIVCGAFHAPVLTAEEPAMTDEEVAKLPRAAVTRTIMPYSYFRLSSQSGYGAGNKAPAYFQGLYEEAQKRGTTAGMGQWFLSELAGRLRKAGMIRSTADVIEAVRLANGIAVLRDSHSPTLGDYESAATACLGHGDPNIIGRFLRDMVVGDAIGTVPPGVLRTSIQDDFQASIKDLRLEDYLKEKEQVVKGSTGKDWLDLRENRQVKSADSAFRDRNRSIFLHRLVALGIGFAADKTANEDKAESTFKEVWAARWTPDCEINLVDNALLGDTIEIAAARKLGDALAECADILAAAQLVKRAVLCDLHDATEEAFSRVQALSVNDGDFVAIATAALELSHLAAYRDVRQFDTTPLEPLIAQLFLRGMLLAPDSSRCNEDAARNVGVALASLHHVAHVFQDKLDEDRFVRTLDAIADDPFAAPHVAGVACAILLERGKLTDDILDQRVSRRLSPGVSPTEGAGFFEGLATRNRYALLARKSLWTAMNAFIETLDDEAFKRAVVALRRAFGSFETSEARRIANVLAEVWGGGERALVTAIETKVDDTEIEALQADLADLGDLDF